MACAHSHHFSLFSSVFLTCLHPHYCQAARTGAELSPAKQGCQDVAASEASREHLYRPLVKPMNHFPLLAAATRDPWQHLEPIMPELGS